MPRPLLTTLACLSILAVALPPAAHAQTVTVNVDTTTPIRPVDEKVFGVNLSLIHI